MAASRSAKIVKWLRIVHRDLGYIMVGICLVYGISGLTLNHRDGNPAYKTISKELTFPPSLDELQLVSQWEKTADVPALKRAIEKDDGRFELLVTGGTGVYSPSDGSVSYEVSQRRPIVYWVNKLHFNQIKGWNIMADIFAGSLIFFAISGLFMIKGKNGLAGRGKWFLLVGLLIPIVYILLS